MIDLYVVESPLQALSAAEAKALSSDEVDSLIFVKYGVCSRKVNNTHLEQAVSFGKWGEVVPLGLSKYKGFKYHIYLILFLIY